MSKRTHLINLRMKKGLKQNDIAKQLGVSQQTISLIETGKRKPTIQMAKQLEQFFKTSMEELFADIFDDIK